jgi:hypothetical protein
VYCVRVLYRYSTTDYGLYSRASYCRLDHLLPMPMLNPKSDRRLRALRRHVACSPAGGSDAEAPRPVVTFGEIMGRLAPPGFLRVRQATSFEVTYAGAEASVASSIVNFGGAARYVTALPTSDNPLAESTMDTLRAIGIDTSYIGAHCLLYPPSDPSKLSRDPV